MRRRHLLSLAMLAAPATVLGSSAWAAPAKKRRKSSGLFINNVEGTTGTGGTFKGNVLITEIAAGPTAGTYLLSGVINGNVFTAAGQPVMSVSNQAFTAVSSTLTGGSQAVTPRRRRECPILNLNIGAINLNVLGLVIDLSPIDLDIVAQSGPGKLLGNLLCALVGLLDPSGLSGLLAQINDILSSSRVVAKGLPL